MISDALEELARHIAGPFAFCGLAVHAGGQVHYAIRTAPGIVVTAQTCFRVASLSKIVTAQLLAGVDLEQPAGPLLGFDLTHPHGGAVTLRQLASHSAGLSDRDLPVAPDCSLRKWVGESDIWSRHPPGSHFSYSNLGYVLLAACAEVVHGRSFAALSSEKLRDWQVPGGFNWAGVPADVRDAALPTFRRGPDGGFIAKVDETPADRLAVHNQVTAVQSATNVARLSPQGGLRTSLAGMLNLARAVGTMDASLLWRREDGPGDYLEGLFHHYGPGLQILPDPLFYPRALVGHFGNAYGFNGGAWHDADRGLSFAYALNGLDIGDESDSLSATEHRIFDAIAALEG